MDTLYEALPDIRFWRVASTITCGYLLYYFYKVVHRPELIAADGEFKSMLVKELDVLREKFWPTFWAFHTHFQTICRVLFKAKPFIPYAREVVTTPDHGQVGLDWFNNDDDNSTFPVASQRPTLVILPGITGCSDASYVRNVVMEAKDMGWRSVVFNNRGMGNTDLKTPRTFCACNVEDLEFVLGHITSKYPNSPLLVFAVSLGGNSQVFQEHNHRLPYKIEDVMKATTIREFDEEFTSKTFGFPSCTEYYTESSLTLKPLENIQIPMLFLNARDDPFAPEKSIPIERIKSNPNIAMILTDYGGHIGFIEGITVNSRSLVERLFRQYATSILQSKWTFSEDN